jgi:hypothetical protein
MRKPFSHDLDKENDKPAREALKEYYLRNYSRKLTENPDGQYGIDLYDPVEKIYHEVEIKRDWKGDRYPFKDVRITNRKMKSTELHSNLVFWVINLFRSKAAKILSEIYRASPLVRMFVTVEGERIEDEFRVITLDKVDWINLTNVSQPISQPQLEKDSNILELQQIEEKSPSLWTDEELAEMAKKYHVKHGPLIWEDA